MSGEEAGCYEEGMVTLVWMVREGLPGLSEGESCELRPEWAKGTSLCQELREQQVQRLRGGQMSWYKNSIIVAGEGWLPIFQVCTTLIFIK